MHGITRIAAGTALAGSLLFSAGMAPAGAAPVVTGGLVNVTLNGNTVTVQDAVDINAAVAAAVTACNLIGVNVNQVAVLARAIAVERTGDSRTICRSSTGDVVAINDRGA